MRTTPSIAAMLAASALVLSACSGQQPAATATAAVSPTADADPTAEPTATAKTTPVPTERPPAAWAELEVEDGPPPREDHTWTVGRNGIAYLFGGRDLSSDFGDLWAFGLTTDGWTLLEPDGPAPSPRFGHEAEWVDGIGLVVFAGQAGADFFNDLWAYDPEANAWRELPAAGAVPVARYGTCAALGPDGRLWISHGFTSELARFADTRAYDFDTDTWTDETPAGQAPVSRCLHGCWWTDDGSFTLYAGQTTGATALGDLWTLGIGPQPGTASWAEVEAPLPPDRNLYGHARDRRGTWIFGGQASDESYLADTWFLRDGGEPQQVAVPGITPAARHGAELIVDASGGRLLLFGGRDGDEAFGDLWQLTGVH